MRTTHHDPSDRERRWPLLLVASAMLGLGGCHVPAPPTTQSPEAMPNAEAEIARLLDDWHAAAARADAAGYFALLAPDAVFLGTDATERWTKPAFVSYAKPHFDRGEAWSFRATRRAIIVHPGQAVAHFDEDLETVGLGPARGTGVVVQRAGRWSIVQYSLAVTVPNDRFGVTKEAAGGARMLVSEPSALDPVGALVGSWAGTADDGTFMEEHWSTAQGGVLIGMARATSAGEVRSFEQLRIEARPGGSIVYVAQPGGGPPTEFTLTPSSSPARLVFENLTHDYPKRLVYERGVEGLRVEISGDSASPTTRYLLAPALVARTGL